MNTKDLINALIFSLADKEIVKQLDAALSGSNIRLTGYKIEKLLDLYRSGSLKGQQHDIYTDMMQAPSQYMGVAKAAIEERSGFLAELYSEGYPLAMIQGLISTIQDDLKTCVDDYNKGLGL
jgi:hypothetical protein